jgi:hypothetical protein
MLGGAEEASEDSTVVSTANELPEAQRRRWGFINGLKPPKGRFFLFDDSLCTFGLYSPAFPHIYDSRKTSCYGGLTYGTGME